MSKREQVTAGQIVEMMDWLRRLTPEEYQKRRVLLRRATDPKQEWISFNLPYPFTDKRPVEWDWMVEREGAPCEPAIDIFQLETVPFHEDRETYIYGEDMMKRAADSEKFPGCQTMGQHAAEQLLLRAAELPQEWANDPSPYLIFTDTILVDEHDSRRIPYLFWHCGRLQLYWRCLVNDFDRRFHFVRLRK